MKSKTIYPLLLAFLLSLCAQAQQDTLVLKPGNKLIDGTVIKPYTNKWKVTYINSEGQATPNKIWTDYGQIIELNDKSYFHRVQELYDPNMNLQDTWINMLEHKTLKPVSFSTTNPNGGFSYYSFDGNAIAGKSNLSVDDSVKVVNTTLAEPVYDWNLYGMLLVGLPLKKGLVAKLPFYNAQSNTLQWLVIRVVEKTAVQLPNKEAISTWKVETNQRLTFWIGKSAPYVIKLELALKGKSKLVWEMI